MASQWGLQSGPSFNGPIWSISVEVLVYIFFFTTLRCAGNKLALTVSIFLACIALRAADHGTLITDCLAFFYLGGITSFALKYFQTNPHERKLAVLAICVLIATPVLAYITNIHQHKQFAAAFLLVYIPPLLYLGAKQIRISDQLQRFVEAAGNMTYSSYLIHFPIQIIFAIYFGSAGRRIPYQNQYLLISYLGLTLVAAYLIYRFFEMPAQTYIREKFLNKNVLREAAPQLRG